MSSVYIAVNPETMACVEVGVVDVERIAETELGFHKNHGARR